MMNFCRKSLKRIKLIVLYITRIVLVRNNFRVSIWNKIRSNIFGGYLADQYVLYDLKNNSKSEYLSEFDWYRSRYINEPFDFAFSNEIQNPCIRGTVQVVCLFDRRMRTAPAFFVTDNIHF